MGKKGKRVDIEKKAALAARKEAKAEKAALKRLKKDGGIVDDEHDDDDDNNDLDALIAQYTAQDASTTTTTTALPGFPAARANFTFTVTDDIKKQRTVYLFGGEYYNGLQMVYSNQLFSYSSSSSNTTNQWKELTSRKPPPPRCAHSTVYYNHCLYVFGGERQVEGGEFVHYKDVWKFDTHNSQQHWLELRSKAGPSPRSGHSAVVWKHFMIVFGGFFETTCDGQFFNTIHVFDLRTEQWLEWAKLSKLAVQPEPRSGCNVCVVDDTMIVHGGFTKLRSRQKSQVVVDENSTLPPPETKVFTDVWKLHLSGLVHQQAPVWERWTTSVVSSRVTTLETNTGTVNGRSGCASFAYNGNLLLFGGVLDQELYQHIVKSVFFNDLWIFNVETRKFIPIKLNETNDSGWDLDKLRANMFAFVDGTGNTVYEKLDNESIHDKRLQDIVERNEPLPRIKARGFLNGSVLYIYGGLLEVGDREVTLDDMWCIDLRKKKTWECLFPGTMHKQIWRGAVHDDDDSYYSSNADDRDEDSDEDIPDKPPAVQSDNPKQEIADLVEKHRLENADTTPQPGESLDDFYSRTASYWNGQEGDKGLNMARQQFDELEPVIERILALKLLHKENKERKKKAKQSKQTD